MKLGSAGAFRRARASLPGCLALLVCIACESAERTPVESSPSRKTEVVASAKPTPISRANPPDTRPTLGRVLGLPTGASLPTSGENKLALDTVIALPVGASMELHFPGGASVRVVGPARVAVPDGPAGLLLQDGTVSVDLELSARHPGSGFWLATPSAKVELVHGARFVVRGFADRSNELTAVSGVLGLTTLGAEGEPSTRLVAGTRAKISSDGHAAIGPAEKSDARTPVHLQTEEARLVGLPERVVAKDAGVTTVQPSVEAACDAVQSSLTREGELQARHRALVAKHDSQAMELQAELARQGAQTFAARRTLGQRLSLLEADSLSQGTSGLSSPLIARARELLR